MSVDSLAEVIPFERFLECRERRRIAVATGTVVVPASTNLSIQPELTERANAAHADSPRCIANRLVDA